MRREALGSDGLLLKVHVILPDELVVDFPQVLIFVSNLCKISDLIRLFWRLWPHGKIRFGGVKS